METPRLTDIRWVSAIAPDIRPLRFMALTMRPYLPLVSVSVAGAIVASGVEAFGPLIYKHTVDAIVALERGGSYGDIRFWVFMYLVLIATRILLWRGVVYSSAHLGLNVRSTARFVLTSYLLKHSQDYFENRFAGSVSGKIGNAADGARHLSDWTIHQYLPFIVQMIVSLGIAFYSSAYIGWIFIGWIAVALPINIYFAKQRPALSKAAQAAETKVRGVTVDIVTNMRAVREFARSALELVQLKNLIEARRFAGLRNRLFEQRITLSNGALQIAATGAMLFIVLYLGERGLATAGDIILVLALTTSMGERLFHLGQQISNLSETWGEIEEGLEDVLAAHDIPDRPGAKGIVVSSGEITFDRVLFSYHAGEAVMSDFSLSISPGEKIGLVGRSGAGKSTLIKLLLRHYELTGGAILIDGQNIAAVTQDSLREAVSIVPQDATLFHRSIRENIAYGRPEATDSEIQEAARLAQAHEFIEALPDGYDTLVGERGVKLSGGQRQRVAIARAILKGAPILLLDEATSALDSESEGAIQQALHALMEGKTVLAIAHRLSTLKEMDRIIVMDGGVVVEDGSHAKLVRKGGVYADLWKRQSGGYLKDE